MQRLVLIVDDSETCAETLEIALQSIPGIATKAVKSARAAIAALDETGSDIAAVVTDLHMPDRPRPGPQMAFRDGFDLIRQLRAEPRFARIPILLISGDSDPRLPERALAQGADAFFVKPYSPSAVRRKLEQLLCV
jgi:two-component system, chemotaxis family, chemotaxis protein CheY